MTNFGFFTILLSPWAVVLYLVWKLTITEKALEELAHVGAIALAKAIYWKSAAERLEKEKEAAQ